MATWFWLRVWEVSRHHISQALLCQIQDAFNSRQDDHARRMSLVLSDYQRIERDVAEYVTNALN